MGRGECTMDKLQKTREAFHKLGIDGLLITSSFNRRYISNFTGTSGAVLISNDKAIFMTDFRYIEQAKKQCAGFQIVKQKGTIPEEVANVVKQLGIKNLGFEQDYLTYSEFKTYEKMVAAELVPVSGVIEKLRLIKTERRD